MRHRVLGLEAVTADGTVMSDLTGVMKVSAGLDAKQLFVGSEGILGVVTRAVIRLEPLAPARATALLGLKTLAAGVALVEALDRPGEAHALMAAELMTAGYAEGSAKAHGLDPRRLGLSAPVSLIVELGAASEDAARSALEDRLAEAMEQGLVETAVIAQTWAQRDAIWLIREASDAMGRGYGLELWYDVSVPLASLDSYLAALGPRLAAVDPAFECHAIGHLADGNLHVMVAAKERPEAVPHEAIEAALYDGLAARGGSFSAEHGVGLDKRTALARFGDPGKLAMMRRLKQALDPNGIMNPGKVLLPI
jgi:FAD/FMN-containing dehydrogenase